MGKLIIIALILAGLPVNVLFSCPAESLQNSVDCPLFMLRKAISVKHFERNLRIIETKIQRAEEHYLEASGLTMADNSIQQEKLCAIKNRSNYQAKKDLIYVIAIIMGRLPKLFSIDDEKVSRRIEIIAQFYPMTRYLDSLLNSRRVLAP